MNENSWITILGDSWMAKAVGVLLMVAMGAFGGWWTSRANIMNAVNEQVKTLMAHYVAEIDRLTHAHRGCEERLDAQDARIHQLAGELRQERQMAESRARIGGSE